MPTAHETKKIYRRKNKRRERERRAPAAAAPTDMANDPEANEIPSKADSKALNSTQSPKNLELVDTQKRQKRKQNLRPVPQVTVRKRKHLRRSSDMTSHSPRAKRPANVDRKPNIAATSVPEQTHSREYQERQGTEDERAQQLLNSTTLWIGKLLFTTTEEKISELFSRAGPVRRVIMGLDREKKTPCGFCFVEYEKRIDAENVMRDKESYVLDGQKLVIGWDVGFTEGRQWGRGRHGGQEIDSPIPLVPSSEPTTIVKTEIDETEYNLRRMSLARKSPVFGMRDSSSPDEMAKRRNQLASNESDEIVPASFEEDRLNSSSQSSGSHSTKSSDTLERGFRDCDQHMNWPAACKECTKEQKKCKYHEEMDRRRANISVDTSQTSDSSEGCHFCKECSNGMCCTHKNQNHLRAVLQPTPQFEISRADQVDTDTE